MISKDDIKLFTDELEELVQKSEDQILKLEEDPSDMKIIQELFYIFHSLKGLTGMAGMANVSKFCHYFETFLEKAKVNKSLMEDNKNFIDTLFESLDILRTVLKNVKNGVMEDIDETFLNNIKDSFEGYASIVDTSFFNPISPEKVGELLKDKKSMSYKIYIRLQSTCVFKQVRLFIILRALNKIGQICWSDPDPKTLEKGLINNNFDIYFISQKKSDEITKVLDEILEIDDKIITEIASEKFKRLIQDFYLKWEEQQEDIISEDFVDDDSWDEDIIDEDIESSSIAEEDNSAYDGKITSVKVDTEIVESLMNYFGELIILKNQIVQTLKDSPDLTISRLISNMDKPFLDIQERLFKLKLVKVETTFSKYKRLVRDLSKETEKKIKLILVGTNVEIDRKILEDLNPSIIQIIRNAVYHGIETPKERLNRKKDEVGTLKLKTYRSAGSIFIEISDNGNGIDYEKIRQKIIKQNYCSPEVAESLNEDSLNQFILLPGFTTLTEADMLSGRGMGLAIVSEKIKELGGSLSIYSEEGVGTTFTVVVPFTRAILKAQFIKVAGELFAIPIENIDHIYFLNQNMIEYHDSSMFYKVEGKLVPMIQLDQYLKLTDSNNDYLAINGHSKIAILCKKDDYNFSIFVADDILQQMDVIVKPFKSSYSNTRDILGSTITTDGTVCLILDVLNIMSYQSNENKITQYNLIS